MDYIRAEHKLHSISMLLISQVIIPHVFFIIFILAYFYSAGTQHGNHVLATANTGEIGRSFGKNAGEWTGRVVIRKEEISGSKRSMHGYTLTYSRL